MEIVISISPLTWYLYNHRGLLFQPQVANLRSLYWPIILLLCLLCSFLHQTAGWCLLTTVLCGRTSGYLWAVLLFQLVRLSMRWPRPLHYLVMPGVSGSDWHLADQLAIKRYSNQVPNSNLISSVLVPSWYVRGTLWAKVWECGE